MEITGTQGLGNWVPHDLKFRSQTYSFSGLMLSRVNFQSSLFQTPNTLARPWVPSNCFLCLEHPAYLVNSSQSHSGPSPQHPLLRARPHPLLALHSCTSPTGLGLPARLSAPTLDYQPQGKPPPILALHPWCPAQGLAELILDKDL